ncbi:helix-turn-helix transcriptional regulator [Kribbella jiaozuonensis]|uniref:Helix-turn-helix domain-containing protein n=1 Tax=Kribbella jiaozuonensis TaxID=2575441 RepID=A0A4U3M0Z1_9ACTN|nr:helix-turn-helix transcriptional regulator [Kribbella jiaozuonensis]TKK81609.1 helix-turn-helix domain-containing protein [Kribbella jiaozuonensis]
MSNKDDVREFLTSRRAKVTPQQAGLQTFGDKRRVAGLRREEVALLAGVSADYYIRLERGNLAGVSEQVLDSLAQALRLDDAERAHLFDLARASTGPVRGSRRTTVSKVRPGVLRLLDALATPAYVRNARTDILAFNDLALALYDGILDRARLPFNVARFLFLDHRAPEFFLDWENVADDSVAALRAEAGRNPHDKSLTDLVGELATRSEEFRTRWARHNVKYHRTAAKRLHNSLVGDLELTGEAMELPGDGLVIITYTAESDSPAAEALRFLSSWATQHSEAQRSTTE